MQRQAKCFSIAFQPRFLGTADVEKAEAGLCEQTKQERKTDITKSCMNSLSASADIDRSLVAIAADTLHLSVVQPILLRRLRNLGLVMGLWEWRGRFVEANTSSLMHLEANMHNGRWFTQVTDSMLNPSGLQ
jgi:hypothetical protein